MKREKGCGWGEREIIVSWEREERGDVIEEIERVRERGV